MAASYKYRIWKIWELHLVVRRSIKYKRCTDGSFLCDIFDASTPTPPLFSFSHKTHFEWYDSRWYGHLFSEHSTLKPAPNFKSGNIYLSYISWFLKLSSVPSGDTVWRGILRISQTPNPNWYDRSICCMFWPEMGLRWHSLVGPTNQGEPAGQIPFTMGDSAAAPCTTLKLRFYFELTNTRQFSGAIKAQALQGAITSQVFLRIYQSSGSVSSWRNPSYIQELSKLRLCWELANRRLYWGAIKALAELKSWQKLARARLFHSVW